MINLALVSEISIAGLLVTCLRGWQGKMAHPPPKADVNRTTIVAMSGKNLLGKIDKLPTQGHLIWKIFYDIAQKKMDLGRARNVAVTTWWTVVLDIARGKAVFLIPVLLANRRFCLRTMNAKAIQINGHTAQEC